MARRRREIGNDQFIKVEDYEPGDTIFEAAIYLGTGEGQYGTFYRFEQEDQVWCLGGRALGNMLESIEEGTVIELQYTGKKASKTKGYKPFATFKMWQIEDDGEEEQEVAKPTPKAKPGRPAQRKPEPVAEDELDETLPPPAKPKPKGRPVGATVKNGAKPRGPVNQSLDEDLDDLDGLE